MTIGVYGKAFGSNAFAGYFDGDVYATTYSGSDSILKRNIRVITNASTILSQIQGRSYSFDTLSYANLNLPHGIQYGVIAQEVERVLPQLVETASSPEEPDSVGNPQFITFKAVNYDGFIPLHITNAQEQMKTIDSLQSRLRTLEENLADVIRTVTNCCSSTGRRTMAPAGNELTIELSSTKSIILNQNDPNPFAEKTNITFFIPDDIQKAEIIFFNVDGKILKKVNVNERGNSSMEVFASNLSSGIYSYSLIADGKLIDTKKMVCSK